MQSVAQEIDNIVELTYTRMKLAYILRERILSRDNSNWLPFQFLFDVYQNG